MAVPEQTPYKEYDGNGVTKTFTLEFICESKDHLKVTINGVEPELSAWSFNANTNSVTFSAAPAADSKIVLQRETPMSRTTNYQSTNNSMTPKALNGDIDRVWLKLQELGLADFLLKLYVAKVHQELKERDDQLDGDINELKEYVDARDDELRSYLMNAIREQGIALDQLDDYYNYLMQRLAQIAVDKGWEASFVVDKSGLNQQQINNLTATPFHFGAIGDGTSHKLSERYTTLADAQAVYPHAVSLDDEIDWCAIQKLNVFAIDANNPKIKIDWSGKFHTNRPIEYIVPASQIGQHRTIEGDIEIIPSVSFIGDDLVVLHGRGIQHKGVIKANLQKRVKWGVQLAARGESGAADYISFGNSVGKLFIDNAIIHAVRFTGNAMFGSVEFLRAGGCGVSSNYAGTKLDATVSSHVNSDAGSLTSKSTMVVDVVPPVTPSETTILVKYGDFISRVTDVDAVTNTLTIVPLLPTISDTSVKLMYMFGGAVRTQGVDSAGGSIQKLTHIGCGIGIEHTAMYPLLVNQYLSEFAGVALYSGGLVSGLDIKQRYIEGDHFVLVQNCTRSRDGITNLDWGLNIDPKKIVDITFGRHADGRTVGTYAGVRGLRLWNNRLSYVQREGKLPNNERPNGVSNGFGVDFNAPHEHKVYKATGNVTVGFMPIDENYNRLFGLDSQEFTVFGTGLNGAPTGVITIPVLDGYTLNGGTTNLTYSGFNAAAHFKFFLNVVAKDIQVSVSGANSYNLSVGTELASDAKANELAVDTKFWFRGSTAATNLPTPTTGNKVDGNISTVYSVAQTGSANNKTQVVEYVTLFEKWERVYSSSTGTYGSWKLISYEVKKGTTAQRPSNPQLGMRYYDTTLLAAGKPIEWNGSSWVDMTGTIV